VVAAAEAPILDTVRSSRGVSILTAVQLKTKRASWRELSEQISEIEALDLHDSVCGRREKTNDYK